MPAHAPLPARPHAGLLLAVEQQAEAPLEAGPALKSAVEPGSAVRISAGKSSSPMWLVNMSSTVARSRIFAPSSVPPPSSMRWKRRYSRGVECSPWPPAHHSGSWDQSSSARLPRPVLAVQVHGTEFARCASLIRNVVWVIPSGPRMCSAK